MTRLNVLMRREPRRGLLILPTWLERVAAFGITTNDREVQRRQRIVNVAAYVAAGTGFSHVVINALHDARGLLLVHIFNALFAGLALLVPTLHRFGENTAAVALATLVGLGTMIAAWLLGTASHVQMYFMLAGAMLLLVGTEHWRLFLLYFVFFAAGLLLTLHYAPPAGLIEPQNTALRDMLTNEVMINTMTVNAVIILYAIAALRRAEVELENEYERSEALVTTILPASIATRIKTEPDSRIADRIECLSILFADLVGFTRAAHELPPEQVVAYLDDLVRCFDALCDQFNAQKIKTIGDCYMAVAGIDGDARDSARAIGNLSLAMLDANSQRPPLGRHPMRLRVGVHCGQATAGIIGDMRFAYDVWGDAVNIAARLESHGVPDRIQVSEAFRSMTDDMFEFQERGTTDIKSIGPTRTFFLTGACA
jgi:adenylate cyclase